MTMQRFTKGCLILLFALPAGLVAQSVQFAQNEVLVKFNTTISTQQVQTTFANAGLNQSKFFPEIGVYYCTISNSQSVSAAVQACRQDPNVDYAEPNYIYTIPSSYCLLYTSPSPRDGCRSRMPSSA